MKIPALYTAAVLVLSFFFWILPQKTSSSSSFSSSSSCSSFITYSFFFLISTFHAETSVGSFYLLHMLYMILSLSLSLSLVGLALSFNTLINKFVVFSPSVFYISCFLKLLFSFLKISFCLFRIVMSWPPWQSLWFQTTLRSRVCGKECTQHAMSPQIPPSHHENMQLLTGVSNPSVIDSLILVDPPPLHPPPVGHIKASGIP